MMEKQAHLTNFIRQIIEEDKKQDKSNGWVVTRFPPEPNGFLHIGHAKSICLNFGLAQEYHQLDGKARCHLRFDDTNPVKEDDIYIQSIKEDVRWLGFDWQEHLYHASDYFDKLYEFAVYLIRAEKAYVCSLSAEDIRAYRGTLTTKGQDSPYRNRTIEENLTLFEHMKNGKFQEGTHVLRAKISMDSGNINMRDPAIYRIKHAHHPVTKDKWCIYPMYDFTHGISDALEGITHSLCTLEFGDHRPLYDWFLEALPIDHHPQQIEFARLELKNTVTSKRKLKQLVDEKKVSGWDDPRMPTLAGLRRRGYPPEALRLFCERIGISKKQTVIDPQILEDCVRDVLNQKAQRRMAILNPLKVVFTNYDQLSELISVANHPSDESFGRRLLPFSSEVYIEASDFMENPPKDFYRLSLGKEVRLRHSYVIRCDEVKKDAEGHVTELRCSLDLHTLGKKPEGRKVKGIIHWVCAKAAKKTTVHLLGSLFQDAEGTLINSDSWMEALNPDSDRRTHLWVEPSLVENPEDRQVYQFERLGYFKQDQPGVFLRTVELRDLYQQT